MSSVARPAAQGRVARVGVAVEELDRALGRRRRSTASWMRSRDRHRSHRLRAVGDALGHRHDVRASRRSSARRTPAPVRPKPQITSSNTSRMPCGRRSRAAARGSPSAAPAAGRARDRLDEAGGDVLGAVEIDEALQIVGELGALLGWPRDEAVLAADACGACGRRPAAPRPEACAVATMPRERDAADVDAVIGPLARDEHVRAALAARLVVGQRDLHRGVDRLRARVAEEDVVEVARA